jgi:uncharacterized protein YfiM (DUF2279 family)
MRSPITVWIHGIRHGLALAGFASCALVAHGVALAQDDGSTGAAQADVNPTTTASEPTSRLTADQVRLRSMAWVAGGAVAVAAYGNAKWWGDGFSGGFKTTREGWFGQNTSNGGADKLGHAFFTYTGSRLLRHAFEWAGNDRDAATRLGFWTSLGIMTGVEVVDGFSRQWRFSREDAALNLAGAALGYWLEKNPAADALIDFRVQYRRSTGPDGRRSFAPFSDYSGQTYLLVFKGSGMQALRTHPVFRYLEFSVGYNARNYEREARGFAQPSRTVYAGISLNLSELLSKTVYSRNVEPSRTQRFTETFFEYVQVPAAAALVGHELN